MIVDIQTRRLRTIGQLRAFVEGNEAVDFQPRGRDEAYGFVRDTLERFGYGHLGKRDKGVVLRFLVAGTGMSLKQTERLVRQWRETGAVRDRRGGGRGRPFVRKYAPVDIRLLADVDEAYGQMSGLATREILRRQFEVFGDVRFVRLAAISNGHVYNLRGSATYRAKRTVWTKTQPTTVTIGLRQAPEPDGKPGHVRVDTVHQGDRDGVKGLYLINLVDEITQYEFVGAVAGISERFLIPLLEGLLLSFPFRILGFHADNGSEYINHRVRRTARKAPRGAVHQVPRPHLQRQLPSSRARTPASCAGGSATTTSRSASPTTSTGRPRRLSPFLNFHRPCLFATEYRDAADKVRRKYLARDVATPYARFRSLPSAEQHLKPGVDFALLDAAAAAETDLEAARRVQAARRALFLRIAADVAPARAAG